MNWFVGIATYIVLWWISIFAVLPWGVKPSEEGDLGKAAGAPSNPRLAMKAAMTTVVAGVLWLFVYWLVTSDLISFRS
jgi:predicted secreted protein